MGKRSSDIKLGKIYIIENDVNDKVYIGQTSDTIALVFCMQLIKKSSEITQIGENRM